MRDDEVSVCVEGCLGIHPEGWELGRKKHLSLSSHPRGMEPTNHSASTSAIVCQGSNGGDGGFSLPYKISIPYLPLRFSQPVDTKRMLG